MGIVLPIGWDAGRWLQKGTYFGYDIHSGVLIYWKDTAGKETGSSWPFPFWGGKIPSLQRIDPGRLQRNDAMKSHS